MCLPFPFAGVIVGHYLQRVTSSVALGAELVYQRGPRVPGGEITVLSLASKITGKTLRDFFALFCSKYVTLKSKWLVLIFGPYSLLLLEKENVGK